MKEIQESVEKSNRVGTQRISFHGNKVIREYENGERIVVTVPEGKIPTVRQGDVYIQKVDALTSNIRLTGTTIQLAPGTTIGSQHTVEQSENTRIYAPVGNVLQGPQIDSDIEFPVKHPVHGDFIFPPGKYVATYQRAFGQTLKRNAD